MTSADDPAPDEPDKLKITNVVIDLTMGLYAFTYADGITEHLRIRDHTDLPTISNFLTALTDEVATHGRPQHPQQPSPPPHPATKSTKIHNGL